MYIFYFRSASCIGSQPDLSTYDLNIAVLVLSSQRDSATHLSSHVNVMLWHVTADTGADCRLSMNSNDKHIYNRRVVLYTCSVTTYNTFPPFGASPSIPGLTQLSVSDRSPVTSGTGGGLLEWIPSQLPTPSPFVPGVDISPSHSSSCALSLRLTISTG